MRSLSPISISGYFVLYLSFSAGASTATIPNLPKSHSSKGKTTLSEHARARNRNLNACKYFKIPDFRCQIREEDPYISTESNDCELEFRLQEESAKLNPMVRIMKIYLSDTSLREGQNFMIASVDGYETLTLNWDLLDVTPFKNQKFPMDQIFTNSQYKNQTETENFKKLTPRGLNILKHYLDRDLIHFHNPKTIEGIRMLIFQKLYSLYLKVKGKAAHENFINWNHVSAPNWPVGMSRNDLHSWTEQDVKFLSFLLCDTNFIIPSRSRPNKKKDSNDFLGLFLGQTSMQSVDINLNDIEGEHCSLSDSEEVCGSFRSKSSKLPVATASLRNLELKSDYKVKSNSEDDKDILEEAKSQSNDRIDEDEFEEKTVLEKRKRTTKQKETQFGFKNVLVKSDAPADPKLREELLEKVLNVYRKDTNQPDAQEIDWNLLEVRYLEYHVIPLDTNLCTEGDLLTLDNLFKSKRVKFLNLKTIAGRAMRIYERLYSLYTKAAGIFSHPFTIRWADINVHGWPEGVNYKYKSWKKSIVDNIEALLDSNEIQMTITEKFREEISRIKIPSNNSSAAASDRLESTSEPTTAETMSSEISSDIPFNSNKKSRSKRNSKMSSKISRNSNTSDHNLNVPCAESSSHPFCSTVSTSSSTVVTSGVYAGLTVMQVNLIIENLRATIESYTLMRNGYPVESRHYNLITEIISCLNLILYFASNPDAEIWISLSEIEQHLASLIYDLETLELDFGLLTEILLDDENN